MGELKRGVLVIEYLIQYKKITKIINYKNKSEAL